MAAAWRDRFQRASFRGVDFETERRDLSGGRRIVQHVYPKRDEPNPEDMGRSPHGIEVDAYIFGPGSIETRERLIAALEQEGTGEYVDAWGKSHEVLVGTWSCREREGQGGYADFRISFLEVGRQRGHSAARDTAGDV
jgi:prophage DNA circulation protein